MQNAIKNLEKDLASAKRILIRGKLRSDEEQDICATLLTVARLRLFVNSTAFTVLTTEVERDYFKAKLNAAPLIAKLEEPTAPTPPAVEAPAPEPAPAPTPTPTEQLRFVCKKCATILDFMPGGGLCVCGSGAFSAVEASKAQGTAVKIFEQNAADHKELCKELEQMNTQPQPQPLSVTQPQSEPLSVGALSQKSEPQSVSVPKTQSGVLNVLNKMYWSCDNEKCGSDDLLHEVPVPPPDGAQIGSKYQCLACGHTGSILLQHDELVKLRGESVVVPFIIGQHDLVVKWRNKPVASETAVKKAPEPLTLLPQPSPELQTAVAALPPAPAKKGRGRPKKNQETPAEKPESFQAQGQVSVQANPDGKKDSNGVQASKTIAASQTPVSSYTDLVAKIAGYESPQVSEEAFTQDLKVQSEEWTMDKILKDWEGFTGKVCDPAKNSPMVPPDKNLRQVLVEQVIAELVGKMCGVSA